VKAIWMYDDKQIWTIYIQRIPSGKVFPTLDIDIEKVSSTEAKLESNARSF
jgi:hypothetical protein